MKLFQIFRTIWENNQSGHKSFNGLVGDGGSDGIGTVIEPPPESECKIDWLNKLGVPPNFIFDNLGAGMGVFLVVVAVACGAIIAIGVLDVDEEIFCGTLAESVIGPAPSECKIDWLNKLGVPPNFIFDNLGAGMGVFLVVVVVACGAIIAIGVLDEDEEIDWLTPC
ncbi:hypothetical protein HUG17_6695 [Dermatophagoides farinae]|uniref:Uncharacterized protein n=1 Tax=Dermatophagoides farinae TaxID=6954 RepID=A0A9D4SJS6_DERFA|nr:hypothetical protein HUG17_6695 [Dermatophagoides farinae]